MHEAHVFDKSIGEDRVEAVGNIAFKILCRVIADGLPKPDELTSTWLEEEHLSRALSKEEANVLAKLALYIEKEAHLSALEITTEHLRQSLLPRFGVGRRAIRRGRPRKQAKSKSEQGKPGAPVKWTPEMNMWLLTMTEIGCAFGGQSTDQNALTWAIEQTYKRSGESVRLGRIKSEVKRNYVKRLSDARKQLGTEGEKRAQEIAPLYYKIIQRLDSKRLFYPKIGD